MGVQHLITFAIQMKLSELSEMISKLDNNVEKFNLQVKSLMEDLSRRGESSDYLNYHLLKAYSDIPIKEWESFVN